MAQDFVNLVGGVSPDEIMKMPKDEQILLMEGDPIRCKQVRYFNDRAFTGPARTYQTR
jgi:type IV secretory pathway TraG/TraD family ATPase VirD4